jgi:hypothetical protein
LYCSPDIIRGINLNSGHEARLGGIRRAYKILEGKSGGKREVG